MQQRRLLDPHLGCMPGAWLVRGAWLVHPGAVAATRRLTCCRCNVSCCTRCCRLPSNLVLQGGQQPKQLELILPGRLHLLLLPSWGGQLAQPLLPLPAGLAHALLECRPITENAGRLQGWRLRWWQGCSVSRTRAGAGATRSGEGGS